MKLLWLLYISETRDERQRVQVTSALIVSVFSIFMFSLLMVTLIPRLDTKWRVRVIERLQTVLGAQPAISCFLQTSLQVSNLTSCSRMGTEAGTVTRCLFKESICVDPWKFYQKRQWTSQVTSLSIYQFLGVVCGEVALERPTLLIFSLFMVPYPPLCTCTHTHRWNEKIRKDDLREWACIQEYDGRCMAS